MLYTQELRLSQFGEYLLKQRLVREGHERYYVFWVRKFPGRRIEVPVKSLEERLTDYLEKLQACGAYKDWLIAQVLGRDPGPTRCREDAPFHSALHLAS